jgi:hypothetical protein
LIGPCSASIARFSLSRSAISRARICSVGIERIVSCVDRCPAKCHLAVRQDSNSTIRSISERESRLSQTSPHPAAKCANYRIKGK